MQEIARQHFLLQSVAGCRLVPYGEHHVETYHEWMKDPWLQGEKQAMQAILVALPY